MERGEEKRGSELINPEEIQIITGLDEEGAERDHAYVRETIGSGSDDLMLSQYCEFYGLDTDEVYEALHPEKYGIDLIIEEIENEFEEEMPVDINWNRKAWKHS
ncbi:MAG: hypothetical protein R2780_01730 [Crocinitomicaceae bacterium]